MFNKRKRKYHVFYRNKRLLEYINKQGEAVTAIPHIGMASANFVCRISETVYEIANARVIKGRYFFKETDLTFYFLKTLKNLLENIINTDYEKLFGSKNTVLIKGNNGMNFIFNGQDYLKSTTPPVL
jgi:hypothetical protein